jgi:two-component system, NarL family, sensor histidine kinase DegS
MTLTLVETFMTRKLLLLKWLMVFIPPVTVAVGHLMWPTLGHGLFGHRAASDAEILLGAILVTLLALVVAYFFVEALFRVLRALQVEALTREQEILSMHAVMQERERLSRELHDGVAQLVADLLLRLDTIKDLVIADRRQEAETELERLHGVAGEIYEDIEESITGLRANVREHGLKGALQDYVDQFEERHGFPVRLQADDAADDLSPMAALQIFRFVQEALTNVRKHADARHASVTIVSGGQHLLQIIVTDDGRGFVPGSKGGGKARPLGLTSMRERVEALGGEFSVESQPGSGTRVTATIPIKLPPRDVSHAGLATPTR